MIMSPVKLIVRRNVLGTPSAPLVFDSPHSGVNYPDDFPYAVDPADLRRAEDTHVDALFDFCAELGAPLVAANFPRSYIDANRSLDDIDCDLLDAPWPSPVMPSAKAELGKGLVWRRLDDGQFIYARRLTVSEVQHRIEACWRPYHAMLRGALDETHARFGFVMHINCHSMPSVSGKYSTERPGLVHPDIVLGDRDGTSADPAITVFLREAFRARGYSCWINDPYKGVELVRAYSSPKANRHAIQLEINRRLYMDEKTLVLNGGFTRVRADLERVMRELIAYCHPRHGSVLAA